MFSPVYGLDSSLLIVPFESQMFFVLMKSFIYFSFVVYAIDVVPKNLCLTKGTKI